MKTKSIIRRGKDGCSMCQVVGPTNKITIHQQSNDEAFCLEVETETGMIIRTFSYSTGDVVVKTITYKPEYKEETLLDYISP